MNENEADLTTGVSAEETNEAIPKPHHIVGIGASAGGLEALQIFFDYMPTNSGLAFVVIQHLSPNHKSLMQTLLEKRTAMAVCPIVDGMPVEANRIYLNQAGKNTILEAQHFKLIDIAADKTPNLTVDLFFRSLAEHSGNSAIAVILSGTGSDGSEGIRWVKEAGGLTFI